jgi:hypothetical protein
MAISEQACAAAMRGMICALWLIPSVGFAGASQMRAPIVQAVIDCRTINDAARRLDCYDKSVDGMVQADAKGDLVTIDREQRQVVRRQAFGLSLPALSMFDRGGKTENLDRIVSTVSAVGRTADGKWIITVEGGAVWRQIDSEELYRNPRPGSHVSIRKAALGSFFMDIDNERAIRVRREY